MKVTVIPEKCIACGKCFSIAPQIFDLDDEGIAYNKKGEDFQISQEFICDVKRAIAHCPTQAIKEINIA